MNKVNIAFACDNNYAMPFAVALESLLANKKEDTFYNIVCLIPEEFSKGNINKINKTKQKYQNFELNFINMKNQYQNAESQIDHISYVTCYRLSLPSILKNEDKCLYIDVDTVIIADLADFYNQDMQDNYLAAVREPESQLDGCFEYFNAGMLLMNLDLLRKDNKEKEFIELIPRKFKLLDQDIVNTACKGKIKQVAYKYNYMTSYLNYKDLNKLLLKAKLKGVYSEQDFINPAIIHYNAPYKPWLIKGVMVGDIWDKYYKITEFGEKKLNRTDNRMLKFYRLFVWFKKIPLLSSIFYFARKIVFKQNRK